jgi:hypothetical protein
MWVVRLTDKQLEVIRALLRSEEHLGPSLQGVLEALDLARWDDLPEASLPWDEVEEAARSQGITEADAVWDLAGHHVEPPAPRKARAVRAAKGRPKTRKRAA